MRRSNLLGEYLRARRELRTPADVGLEAFGTRRVPGLRREEVALLAGISADYYLRLEQGRNRHPSAQVLEALARVLCPDPTAAAHLLRLGAGTDGGPSTIGPGTPLRVPASVRQLVQALSLPAFVQDKHMDTLDANAAARALSPTFAPGHNRLLVTFLDPAERALFADWDDVTAELVASFRASVAGDADDRRTAELVAELTAASGRFRELWARSTVESRVDRPPMRLRHPVVGELTVTRENLAVDGPGELRLVIFHAAPGSSDADRLAQLR